MADDALFVCCQELLAFCDALLAATPSGSPSRQFVSNGIPPFDCPSQLTVHVATLGRAPTAPQGAALDRGGIAVLPQYVRSFLVATVIRPVPVITENADTYILPPEGDVTASSLVAMTDAFVLYQGLMAGHRQGFLLPPPWRSLDVMDAQAVEAQGGVTGWQVPIAVQLDMVIDSP